MSELVRLIEENLDGYLAISDRTQLNRKLRPMERSMIALKIANTLSWVESEHITEKTALRQLLAVTTPSERSGIREVQTIVDALESLVRAVPRQLLGIAISELALLLVRELGPVDFDPLERQCLVPELLETLRSVDKLCTRYYMGYLVGHDTDEYSAARSDVAERVLDIIEGISRE